MPSRVRSSNPQSPLHLDTKTQQNLWKAVFSSPPMVWLWANTILLTTVPSTRSGGQKHRRKWQRVEGLPPTACSWHYCSNIRWLSILRVPAVEPMPDLTVSLILSIRELKQEEAKRPAQIVYLFAKIAAIALYAQTDFPWSHLSQSEHWVQWQLACADMTKLRSSPQHH